MTNITDGQRPPSSVPSGYIKLAVHGGLAALTCISALLFISDRLQAIAGAIAGVCLVLWLLESMPCYVPTLLLWAAVPMFLEGYGKQFALGGVLKWAADPVLALFFGGFAFAAAASRYRIGESLAAKALNIARGNAFYIMGISLFATAFLSMWISNVAAAALMIATILPLCKELAQNDPVRRGMLLGIALGANFGGMATPLGSGPNALAVAAMENHQDITFIKWMLFGVPITVGMLLLSLLLLRVLYRVKGRTLSIAITRDRLLPRATSVLAIFAVCVTAWLTEGIHGISSATVSLSGAGALFALRLLDNRDLAAIDWSTLILIAGGLTMGRLLEDSGLVKLCLGTIAWDELSSIARLLLLCGATAFFSAIMSNTATAAILIPSIAIINLPPATAILIAMSASMGNAFPISTPPNAMAYGQGLPMRDILVPGLILMTIGVIVVAVTGRHALAILGVH